MPLYEYPYNEGNPPPYKEGDCFCIPLQSGGYALGLVSREDEGIILGYFFKPRLAELPNIKEIPILAKENTLHVGFFGYLGFKLDNWPILGQYTYWKREDWPIPVMSRLDSTSPDKSVMVVREDNEVAGLGYDIRVDPEFGKTLPEDGLDGHISIANYLDMIIDEETPNWNILTAADISKLIRGQVETSYFGELRRIRHRSQSSGSKQ